MKFTGLNIPAAKSVTPKRNSSSPPPLQSPTRVVRDVPIGEGIGGADRRRTQRVLLRVRANIHVALQGLEKSFEVLTLSVSPHGAMVVMKQGLPAETRLVLEHRGTRQKVACRVPRASKETPDGFQVSLEFDSLAPDFWRIAFPPEDWRPE